MDQQNLPMLLSALSKGSQSGTGFNFNAEGHGGSNGFDWNQLFGGGSNNNQGFDWAQLLQGSNMTPSNPVQTAGANISNQAPVADQTSAANAQNPSAGLPSGTSLAPQQQQSPLPSNTNMTGMGNSDSGGILNSQPPQNMMTDNSSMPNFNSTGTGSNPFNFNWTGTGVGVGGASSFPFGGHEPILGITE